MNQSYLWFPNHDSSPLLPPHLFPSMPAPYLSPPTLAHPLSPISSHGHASPPIPEFTIFPFSPAPPPPSCVDQLIYFYDSPHSNQTNKPTKKQIKTNPFHFLFILFFLTSNKKMKPLFLLFIPQWNMRERFNSFERTFNEKPYNLRWI